MNRSSKEIISEIEELQVKDRRYNSFINEGHEGYTRNSVSDDLEKELEAALLRVFEEIWTKESTILRRKKWNDCVVGLGDRVNLKEIIKLEKDLGFTASDLKKAVAKWGI